MAACDFTKLSHRNRRYNRVLVPVANGTVFTALVLTDEQAKKATNVLYLHVHKSSRKCYVGITVQEAGKRWHSGVTYKMNPLFGSALNKYGWAAFQSYILCFANNRNALNAAEIQAIASAGGHKSRFTYNLSPGGDFVADNNIPIVGVHLPTGKIRKFAGGSTAARQLRLGSADAPMAVVRGEIAAASNWWFRLASDSKAKPPKLWGEALRKSRLRELNGRPLIAIHYETKEARRFETSGEAALALGVHQSEVSAVANGKSHSAAGWWFTFVGDQRAMPALRGSAATRQLRDKPVFAVHLRTGARRRFRNCTAADQELGIYKGGAAMVAAGHRTSALDW